MKGKLPFQISVFAKISFKHEGSIKTFTENQELREFVVDLHLKPHQRNFFRQKENYPGQQPRNVRRNEEQQNRWVNMCLNLKEH